MRALARFKSQNGQLDSFFYSYTGGGLREIAVVCLLFTGVNLRSLRWFVMINDLRWFALDYLRCSAIHTCPQAPSLPNDPGIFILDHDS